ncbi:hypothetical protein PVAND_014358 [Polypedilum vanderplanki]|uniref:ATP-dependent DNA helicase n=1 Tax=Polypedilum vanderplanki TaxID=319348 RepID=A0A9J6B9X9_POLVA|nr:hypothetical protein PVAND_014358 [Polypedilum vanderplanki]
MKLRALGCDRQLGIKSGVVNVPIDVRKTIESIPARPDDCGVIELSLKRKTAYKSHYMKERVRPGAIWKAAQLLCNTELYKQEGITLNHTYESQDMNLQLPESSENIESNIETSIVPNSELRQTDTEAVPSNNDEENYIQEETLLDSNEGINFAPGEGQIPIPMFLDKYCEELAFPTIFFGTARKSQPTGVRLSYEDIVKSELQRYDRRACRADHLLFVHKKSQIKQLMGQMNIVFRKTSREANITAAQVANKDYIDNSISQDHAYKFMASITGTPAYWEQQKKKVLGMVRQYGIFTLFITLTAAETHWKELLVILKKTVDMEDITEEAAGDLSFEEKARLIRTDPVTCAQYFDHRFKEVRKTWINVENGPFGKYKIIHYFYRIEFQHRGSPHVHMVIWIENAPIFVPYDVESEAIVAEFTDLVSTTDSDDPLIQDFIKYQMHKCSQTCKKMSRGNAGCRFGAPFRPMDKTRILYPFDDDTSKEMTKKIRDLNKKIQDMLNDKPEEIGTFEEMLHKLDCTLDLYLLATRANLKHPTIFIKREPKNTRVNVYNKLILPLMRSNMDIQFVLDPYSGIAYIVDYVNKSSRGLSKLLRECVEETKRGNKSLKETLKSLAHILYNSSEISAQEAAWCRLRLPMCKCSDLVEFINTSHSLKRTHMLKSAKEINRLAQIDPTNTDIFKKGSIEHYANRPNELEELCLAEFVANYTFNCKAGTTTHEDENIEVDAEVEPIEDNSVQTNQKKLRHFLLKDNSGTIKERKTPKVIRYCRFSIETDEENFMREMCLLFLPWRNEKQDIEDNDCANLYLQNRQIISENYSKFNAIDLDINDIVRDIEEERRLQEQAQDANDPENLNPEENADFFNVYEFDDNVVRPDLMNEIGEVSLQERTSKYIVPNIYSDEEYLKLCDSLNSEQRDYLMHVISCFKDGNELPIYHFISGGAGVGKTCLVRALFQSLMRVFRSLPGTAKKNEIVLAASTGMAAHNIGGITTHQAFHLTISRGNSSSLLSPDIANTMAADLHDLKLIIIDEISMLSSELFYQISSRLKQIFRTNQEFGGKSVIVVGDFNQLRPVGGTRTFLPKDSNSANSTSILTENLQWNLFKLYKLTKVMRQRDDLKFAEALNRIPSGETTAEDIQMFDSRSFTEQTLPNEAKKAVRLMRANHTVDVYNMSKVRELETTVPGTLKIIHRAEDRFSGNLNERQKNQARRSIETLKKEDTQNLLTELQLVTGMKYMISSNIDVPDGLFNGATGILKFIEVVNNRLQAVYLEMEDKNIGKAARLKRKALMEKNKIQLNWTPIFKVKKSFNVLRKGIVQVTREQYPLIMAEGITVHKSQGLSLPRVTIDLVSSNMEREMKYVALSRATSLNGLYLLGKFVPPDRPKANDPVRVEMERMQNECQLVPKFKKLREIGPHEISIISHNVQSLRKHLGTISSDDTYLSSYIILCQETWANNGMKYEIPGYTEINRNNFSGSVSIAQGTMIFVKTDFINSVVPTRANKFESGKHHVDITSCVLDQSILILNVYRNPGSGVALFKEAINFYLDMITEYDCVLMFGDMNEDLSKDSELERYLISVGLKLLSEQKSTTNFGTTLDAVFTKCNLFTEVNIYESYFSYHKPILVKIFMD